MNRLIKYLRGELKITESKEFAEEVNSSKDNRSEFIEGSKLWDSLNVLEGEARLKSARLKFENTINKSSKSKTIVLRKAIRIAVAALIVALLGVAYLMKDSILGENHDFNTRVAKSGEIQNIYLPDGTHVVLNSGSVLKYAKNFKHNRVVFLSGEAYFDVKKSGDKFRINADEMVITVLGTAFNVRNYATDDVISTTLVRGKVQVANVLSSFSRTIKPGDQAVMNRVDKSMIVQQVHVSMFNSWIRGVYRFNDESLKELSKRIERVYDVKVNVDTNIQSLLFSGSFSNTEKLNDVLKMIRLSSKVPVEIKIKNNIVFIKQR